MEEGTLYPALHRLERRGFAAEWGVSENNRRAKYYGLTADGRPHLDAQADTWRQYADAVAKVLAQGKAK